MRIRVDKQPQVGKALHAVQSGCRERMIDVDDIAVTAARAETVMATMNIPKCARQGQRLMMQHRFGKKPNSYKGSPAGTFVILERGAKHWYVVSATRTYAEGGRAGLSWHFFGTQEVVRNALVANFERDR